MNDRSELRRGVQHVHDPVQRREGFDDGWYQEDQADVCEAVRALYPTSMTILATAILSKNHECLITRICNDEFSSKLESAMCIVDSTSKLRVALATTFYDSGENSPRLSANAIYGWNVFR